MVECVVLFETWNLASRQETPTGPNLARLGLVWGLVSGLESHTGQTGSSLRFFKVCWNPRLGSVEQKYNPRLDPV